MARGYRPVIRPVLGEVARIFGRAYQAGGAAAPSLTTQVAALFAATSAKGYMLRLDSAGTLFQSSGGTGAVTTVSDPVGYAADLSGNGNHFTQATAGNRPLWNGTGCDLDGTNDGLSRAALDLSGATHIYKVFAGQKTTGNNNACIMFHSTSPTVNDGCFGMTANGGSLVNMTYSVRGVTSSTQARISQASDVMLSTVAYWNLTVGVDLTTQLDVWLNAASQTVPAGVNTGIAALTTQDHYLGTNGSQPFAGKFRRVAVFATNAALSSPELDLLIAWAEEGRLGFP